MVNGKPSLVFGGNEGMASLQPRSSSPARNGATSPLTATPEFASFLPTATNTAKPVASPAAKGGPSLLPSFSMQGVHSDLTTAMRQGAGLDRSSPDKHFTGSDAAVALGAVNGKNSGNTRGRTPAGNQSRAEASSQAQAAVQQQSTRNTRRSSANTAVAANGGASSLSGAGRSNTTSRGRRVSSDTPVTGRNAIGMEDTRRTRSSSAGGSTLAKTSGMAFFGPSAATLQAQETIRAQGLAMPGSPPAHSMGAAAGTSGLAGMGSMQGYNFGFGSPQQAHGGNMTALSKALGNPQNPLDALNALPAGIIIGAGRPVDFPDRENGAIMAVHTASHRRNSSMGTALLRAAPNAALIRGTQNASNGSAMTIGALAAKFESGSEGIAAIGYDRHGGTSYGKYQLSSRAGTLGKFVTYLEETAPDLAKKLSAAGPANTGRRNGKMPEVWRGIAAAEPERFEDLQNDFIRKSHFEPTLKAIQEKTGIVFDSMPSALQEVVFSTAVQHGPAGATRIISRAVDRVGAAKLQLAEAAPENFKRAGQDLIKQVYSIRKGQFVSSTERVQAAAKNRLNNEMREALAMLA